MGRDDRKENDSVVLKNEFDDPSIQLMPIMNITLRKK